MEDALSDQAFEEWYNTIAKYSTTRLDTALAGWRACAKRARENRWAAFSEPELARLRLKLGCLIGLALGRVPR